eukprot:CAMPEP_0172832298 /NCGR_PEP_ID=MMETSP1075-20121228/23559_1 /TAXON_ID=2916 /ORGANISM="Ceratium fusus, Strain PA161109" /LENGTH=116 /DNA_ID=CAMNT_0013674871 /DNA_START=18 /DNA_END=368 /DNA_ORIENTATION=-
MEQLRGGHFKSKMCNFNRRGRCKNGANCHFAHSPEEQQQAYLEQQQQRQQHQQHLSLPQLQLPTLAEGKTNQAQSIKMLEESEYRLVLLLVPVMPVMPVVALDSDEVFVGTKEEPW